MANQAADVVLKRREILKPYIAAWYGTRLKKPPERILYFASPLQAYLTLAYLRHPSWRPVWKSARKRYGSEVWATFKEWFFANFDTTLSDPFWDKVGRWVELIGRQDFSGTRRFDTLLRQEIWAGPLDPDPFDEILDRAIEDPPLEEELEWAVRVFNDLDFDAFEFDDDVPFLNDSPEDYRYVTDDPLVCSLELGILPEHYPDSQVASQPEEAGWWWAFEPLCVIAAPPLQIAVDSQGRLHNESGPALVFQDGWSLYCLHGVNVPANAILAPHTITVDQIDQQMNIECCRALIECYGLGRYLTNSGAVEIHRDSYGILYRRQTGAREPLVAVKVVNSTPEPDGSYREYFIRVPPAVTTAHEAVAWSFGLSPAAYHPHFET